jgi:hypothetical protein
MKGLFSKAIIIIAGIGALLGVSVADVRASVPDISEKSALFLEQWKSTDSSSIAWHSSHESHGSHGSHGSHASHNSQY